MAIVGTLPNILTNGTTADASQVMADFNFIANQVNANAVPIGTPQPGQLIGVQVFTASGTYTPTVGMRLCVCEVQGAGGAGGGAGAATGVNVSLGAPGAPGAYAKMILTSGQIGASKAVAVGAGGLGAISTTGGTGGSSSIGALITALGGPGGGFANNTGAPSVLGNFGASTASGTGQQISISAGQATLFTTSISNAIGFGAPGGNSLFGSGAISAPINTIGSNAVNFGAGGSGVLLNASGGSTQGGNGFQGIVIIYEYA